MMLRAHFAKAILIMALLYSGMSLAHTRSSERQGLKNFAETLPTAVQDAILAAPIEDRISVEAGEVRGIPRPVYRVRYLTLKPGSRLRLPDNVGGNSPPDYIIAIGTLYLTLPAPSEGLAQLFAQAIPSIQLKTACPSDDSLAGSDGPEFLGRAEANGGNGKPGPRGISDDSQKQGRVFVVIQNIKFSSPLPTSARTLRMSFPGRDGNTGGDGCKGGRGGNGGAGGSGVCTADYHGSGRAGYPGFPGVGGQGGNGGRGQDGSELHLFIGAASFDLAGSFDVSNPGGRGAQGGRGGYNGNQGRPGAVTSPSLFPNESIFDCFSAERKWPFDKLSDGNPNADGDIGSQFISSGDFGFLF